MATSCLARNLHHLLVNLYRKSLGNHPGDSPLDGVTSIALSTQPTELQTVTMTQAPVQTTNFALSHQDLEFSAQNDPILRIT